ncbi:hypothetical protein FQN54_002288 [Arachnomyces sp. PD_36]|nr:hypothetical protein FQN54_002288 [Arachnomyces sp. PD_36]
MALRSQPAGENSSQGPSKSPTCSNNPSSGGSCPHSDNCSRSEPRGPHVFRFRHYNNPSVPGRAMAGKPGTRESDSFSDNQPWLKITSDLVFIDQTKELRTIYDGLHSREGSVSYGTTPGPSQGSDLGRPTESVEHGLKAPISLDRNGNDSSHQQQHNTAPSEASLPTHPSQAPEYASTSIHNIPYNQTNPSPTPSLSPQLNDPSWPAFNAEETHLMRHFIQNLASWFDVCDHQRHFELVVPQTAATSIPLQKAIFATAARHLSRISDYDPSIWAGYYQECLDALISMAKGDEAIKDEMFLVATVIVRLLEELEATSHRESRPFGHLVGIQSLINAQKHPDLMTSSLHRAAFLVGIRQEIYVAFVVERAPVQTACFLGDSMTPTDDDTWAFRMVFHCSKVLEFAYGDSRDASGYERGKHWEYLLQYSRKWHAMRPSFFAPMYTLAEEDLPERIVLPTVIFQTETHVIAAIHYYMSLILLSLYNPSLPDPASRSSASFHAIFQELDENVQAHVKTICGIALHRPEFATAAIIASGVVTRCRETFKNSKRTEQEALLDVLEMTETKHAWPTADARSLLRDTWNLAQSSESGIGK